MLKDHHYVCCRNMKEEKHVVQKNHKVGRKAMHRENSHAVLFGTFPDHRSASLIAVMKIRKYEDIF